MENFTPVSAAIGGVLIGLASGVCQRRSKSQPKGGAKVGHFSCGASAWEWDERFG